MNNHIEKSLNTLISIFIFKLLKLLAKHKLDITNLPEHYQPLITELDNFNQATIKRRTQAKAKL